ncbi:DUF721 domain-containing protein [Pseudooceanicola sediminis]|uniref:DUF721 domain-containing protein n=1 Tax=Pseudooceanicola sediminis TaxID=2211117 RepID=A0A399J793_9RHOB|nr:DciA family protein [Pseudooceanicola sediminis]KAA2315682.1 DUF721 domain-containing protein [Puniceibacterium sp. HSS470]RII40119.1 DUF721 domain-containing protein [Pseudooceanicola sediminis]
MPRRQSSTYGFTRTYGLLESRIRKAGETRGFAISRLLTHWEEIAGADIAAIARPVEVKYPRGNLGGTLVLLTTGAHAPVLEMQKDVLRERVNGVYGYNAIARVRITQTASTGFAEGQVAFEMRKAPAAPIQPDPQVVARASAVADGVKDDGLKAALEALARNVLGKSKV